MTRLVRIVVQDPFDFCTIHFMENTCHQLIGSRSLLAHVLFMYLGRVLRLTSVCEEERGSRIHRFGPCDLKTKSVAIASWKAQILFLAHQTNVLPLLTSPRWLDCPHTFTACKLLFVFVLFAVGPYLASAPCFLSSCCTELNANGVWSCFFFHVGGGGGWPWGLQGVSWEQSCVSRHLSVLYAPAGLPIQIQDASSTCISSSLLMLTGRHLWVRSCIWCWMADIHLISRSCGGPKKPSDSLA